MNAYRKMMIADGGNLGWCKPYLTDDGKIGYAYAEGMIVGVRINGKDVEHIPDRGTADYDAMCERLARALFDNDLHDGGATYDDYDGYSAEELVNINDNAHECDCSECPWFRMCDAMDGDGDDVVVGDDGTVYESD